MRLGSTCGTWRPGHWSFLRLEEFWWTWMVKATQLTCKVIVYLALYLMWMLCLSSGGEVDLMSRRVIAANNKAIAQRIVKEIASFSPPRDDAPPLKQWTPPRRLLLDLIHKVFHWNKCLAFSCNIFTPRVRQHLSESGFAINWRPKRLSGWGHWHLPLTFYPPNKPWPFTIKLSCDSQKSF